jgi:hypothetical protein
VRLREHPPGTQREGAQNKRPDRFYELHAKM